MTVDDKWKYFHLRQMFVILNNVEDGRIGMSVDVAKNWPIYLSIIDEGRLIANFNGKNYLSNAYVGVNLFFSSVKKNPFSNDVSYDHDALLNILFSLQMFFENGLLFSKSVQNSWEEDFVKMINDRGGVL